MSSSSLVSLEGFLEEADLPEAILKHSRTALDRNVAPLSRPCPVLPPGIMYNATMDERRYTPRAHLDEGGDRYTNRAALLSCGQEHCERISFHVLVSLMPCNPNSRAEAPIGSGHRAGGGATVDEAESSAGGADPRRPASGQRPRPWPPQRKVHWDTSPTASLYHPPKSLLPQLSGAPYSFSRG